MADAGSFKVVSVNVSEEKGTVKQPVGSIRIDGFGVDGDAHAGDWNRQVSLLGTESIAKFQKQMNRIPGYGEFAENITTQGKILYKMSPLDRLQIGDVELEVTQIGKECHGKSCAIFQEVGNCVMPKEGIFARVVSGGIVAAGMEIRYQPCVYQVWIITLSDRASRGEYTDRSGPEIAGRVKAFFASTGKHCQIRQEIIPDEASRLKALLDDAGRQKVDVLITTGGTGVGPRDITPEVVRPVLDKELPGIMEMIRMKYGTEKPHALLSRGVAGVMDSTLVYTLPGSVKAVSEYMEEILKSLQHAIWMLHGIDAH